LSPRKLAKLNGENKYLSEKPCAKNLDHGNLRYTNNSACVQCALNRPVHKLHSLYNKKSKAKYKEKIKLYNEEYYQRPDVKAARCQRQRQRESLKSQARVVWNKELDELVMTEAYLLAQTRGNATGVLHHVDHIVPLKGKNVCGFHSWNNIRVVPWYENLSKSNSLLENLL